MLAAFFLCALVAAKEPWTVVIDPGHGGYQPGAKAGDGKYEKHLTLEVAQRLKRALVDKGFTVWLTRDGDKYVSLGGRSRFANEKHADVLVSIHANDSANAAANGIETYFLAANASDKDAEALAEKENDDPHGDDDDRDLLGTILSDLRRTNAQIESELLATRVQGAVIHGTDAKSRGVKRAPLAVLKRTEMAAVLVEIGFLTHKEERARLWSDAYQTQLARGLAAGVERFLTDVQSGSAPEIPPVSEAPYVSLDRKKAAAKTKPAVAGKKKPVAAKKAAKTKIAAKNVPKNLTAKKKKPPRPIAMSRPSHAAR
ncbi:MAG: N-acetylmuramoyl-L-alanine amidase [Deltaproteobacteria bacterium]|nr:N-acetylmuramoyl-L-alanine amidase [Deltaproteobacteria bacterium]